MQCTELCGSGHGEMHFKNIHVLSQAALRQVAAERQGRRGRGKQQAAQANPGLAVFNSAGCGGCHTFTPAKSSGTTGPSLDDLSQDFTRAKQTGKTKATDLAGFIRESIVDPNAYIAKGYAPGIMPRASAPA